MTAARKVRRLSVKLKGNADRAGESQLGLPRPTLISNDKKQ